MYLFKPNHKTLDESKELNDYFFPPKFQSDIEAGDDEDDDDDLGDVVGDTGEDMGRATVTGTSSSPDPKKVDKIPVEEAFVAGTDAVGESWARGESWTLMTRLMK